MTSKLRIFLAQLSYIPRALRLIWSASKGWTTTWAVLLVTQGLLPATIVYLSRIVVDDLVQVKASHGDWESLRPLLLACILMGAAILLTEMLQSAVEWVRTAQSEFVQDHISALVHEKSVSVDMSFYESPEYFDQLNRVRTEASGRSLALLESGGSLLQNGITLLAMGAILLPYGLWLPPALLISTLPALFVVLRFDRRYHTWWKEATIDRRWVQYYDAVLTLAGFAPEIRLYGLSGHFRTIYQKLRQRLRGENITLTGNQSLARVGASLFALLIAGVTMAWMARQVFMGLASLGDLALFYQAFNRGQGLMRGLLSNLGKVYSNTLFLGNLFEFLGLESKILDPEHPVSVPSPLREGIRLEQVTFRYPGSERFALEDFNLFIPSGQITAIVGPNGAGKSTMVKLLCRFYDPEAGCIRLDQTNIREMALEELRREVTVLLQMPVPYHATAAQNIAFGNYTDDPKLSELEYAARSAGAHDIIRRLPNGYGTLLSKWFPGGTELSTGEWQRIALARAFFRGGQIIILDEPTSFMDSWAEADWFERFRDLADGRTSVIITHRFTTAMRADIIHVVNEGHIVESGNHNELIANNGFYAQSWKAQMSAQCGSGLEPAERESDEDTQLGLRARNTLGH